MGEKRKRGKVPHYQVKLDICLILVLCLGRWFESGGSNAATQNGVSAVRTAAILRG